MRQLLLCLYLIFPCVSTAGIFGPSNYEDCVLEGVRTAKTDAAVSAVYHACGQKFEKKSRLSDSDKKKRESLIKKCGLQAEDDTSGTVVISGNKRPAVNKAISQITERKFDAQGQFSFQNKNSFAITLVYIGFTKAKMCPAKPEDYEFGFYCGNDAAYGVQVSPFSYGTLNCQPQVREMAGRFGHCLVAIGPAYDATTVGLAQTMDRLGWCE